YFPTSPALDSLRKAKPDERAQLWRDFWKASDPTPNSPTNEALDAYFRRVALANQRCRDDGVHGWRPDRGEVLIRLGEPDEVNVADPGIVRHNASTGNAIRGGIVRWGYTQYQLVIYFVDEGGFGRYRLDTASRAEFERVVSRLERQAR